MASRIEWHGDRLYGDMERRARDAVRRSAVMLHTRARVLANTPATRIRRRRRRDTAAGPRGSTYTEFVGSSPGESPALRTGFGKSHVQMEIRPDGLSAKVGPTRAAEYMGYLETGTRTIEPRPWLSKAVDQCRAAIGALLRAALGNRR